MSVGKIFIETRTLANQTPPFFRVSGSFESAFWAFVESAEFAASVAAPNRDFSAVGALKLRGFFARRDYLVAR